MRISTIIPAFNRADLIGETLRSVLEQDRPPDEVIVIDDGSSDGTSDAVAAFGKAVTLIRQANAGPSAARNAGFAASSGDVVHFMDSDDLLTLNFYRVGLAAFEAGAEMTYGPWLKTRIDGRTLAPEPFAIQQGPIPGRASLQDLLLVMDWGIVFQPCLFRRDIVLRAGRYRVELTNWEDNELMYRIAAVARSRPVHSAQSLTLYRLHPENQITHLPSARRVRDHAAVAAIFDRTLGQRSDVSPAIRRAFRRKKVSIARAVRDHEPDMGALLLHDVSALDRAVVRLEAFRRWLSGRFNALTGANPYLPAYAAAALSQGQRDEIARLGYILP